MKLPTSNGFGTVRQRLCKKYLTHRNYFFLSYVIQLIFDVVGKAIVNYKPGPDSPDVKHGEFFYK